MVRKKLVPLGKSKLGNYIEQISGESAKNCIQCGKCSASCPASNHMDILPHKFVRLVQMKEIEKLQACETLWACVSCFNCSARCPRTVDPAKLIEAVRLSVVRPSGANRLKIDDVIAIQEEAMPQQALVSALRKYSK